MNFPPEFLRRALKVEGCCFKRCCVNKTKNTATLDVNLFNSPLDLLVHTNEKAWRSQLKNYCLVHISGQNLEGEGQAGDKEEWRENDYVKVIGLISNSPVYLQPTHTSP